MSILQRTVSGLVPVLLAASVPTASATTAQVDVIHTEIVTSATSLVAGALDGSGQPAVARLTAIEDMNVSHDGTQWIVKGRSDLGSTLDSILILGSGLAGTSFAQDGQPFQGGAAGELYDFFDTPVPAVWDDNNNIAFSARAKGGSSAVFEKVVVVNGATHTIVVQMGDPALGVMDVVANPTGDELFGNSINSLWLQNSGVVGFTNTPIQNCHSTRYPAIFLGNTSFRQSGVSTIGGETWDNFGLSDAGGTPDGLHWFAEGDTENSNTAIDGILVVDDVIVLREGSPLPGSAMTMTDVFHVRMLSNGDWFARGDDPNNDDWAVRNSVVLAVTGDPISGSENWGDAFGAFTGNRVGDWLLIGNTTNANPDLDEVMVLNGSTVLARESDPIDLDGNGSFDDGVFLRSFGPNDVRMTDDCDVYALVTLKDGAGTNLGDAFVRFRLCGDVTSYGAGCPGSGGFVPALALTGCPRPGQGVTMSVANGLGGATAIVFLGLAPASIPMDGGCVALLAPLPGIIAFPLNGSGAGNGTFSVGGALPPNVGGVTFTMQVFVADPGVPHGFANSNALQVAIK